MNRTGFAALLSGSLLSACAYTSPVKRQVQPDGSYRFDCKVALPQCLSSIGEVCPQGYEVLRAHQDARVAGPREITEPTMTSEAIVRCQSERPVFSGQAQPAATTPEPAPTASGAGAATPRPDAPKACFPGATQACVGPAGCRGGQVCLPDGAAFGPCDCGGGIPAPAPAPAAPEVNVTPPR